MSFRSDRPVPVRGRIFSMLVWLLHILIWAAPPATAAAQDQPGPNIIITNDAAGVQPQGAFQQINSRLSRSPQALRSTGTGPHRVSFAAKTETPGYYRVFVWWPQVYDQSVGAVDVVVHYARGLSTVTMDQRVRSGQWVPVGIFEFGASGAQVDLVGRPGATLLADAVRLQYLGTQMPPLDFETDAVPVALTGEQYGAWFDVIGGTPPFTFAADQSRLPAGLVLDAASGTLGGVPTAVGSYQFTMAVVDGSGQRALRTFTIEVIPGSTGSSAKKATAMHPMGMTPYDGVPAGTPPDLSNLIGLIAPLPEGEWVRANLNAYSDVWTPDDLRPLMRVEQSDARSNH